MHLNFGKKATEAWEFRDVGKAHLSALSSLASLLCDITIFTALEAFDRKAAFVCIPWMTLPRKSARQPLYVSRGTCRSTRLRSFALQT